MTKARAWAALAAIFIFCGSTTALQYSASEFLAFSDALVAQDSDDTAPAELFGKLSDSVEALPLQIKEVDDNIRAIQKAKEQTEEMKREVAKDAETLRDTILEEKETGRMIQKHQKEEMEAVNKQIEKLTDKADKATKEEETTESCSSELSIGFAVLLSAYFIQ
eukprot:GHVO01041152.1.p1 GENE.GHVO01041152.1~~GHVO01041152.1.p1  ORF type:complete len:164 (-),score=34.39 GHVO01041152.1:42-533(-)